MKNPKRYKVNSTGQRGIYHDKVSGKEDDRFVYSIILDGKDEPSFFYEEEITELPPLPLDDREKDYDYVNPAHYKDNAYGEETIKMMEKQFGIVQTAIYQKINAFKYRMRAGCKPKQAIDLEIQKALWYEQGVRDKKEILQSMRDKGENPQEVENAVNNGLITK